MNKYGVQLQVAASKLPFILRRSWCSDSRRSVSEGVRTRPLWSSPTSATPQAACACGRTRERESKGETWAQLKRTLHPHQRATAAPAKMRSLRQHITGSTDGGASPRNPRIWPNPTANPTLKPTAAPTGVLTANPTDNTTANPTLETHEDLAPKEDGGPAAGSATIGTT